MRRRVHIEMVRKNRRVNQLGELLLSPAVGHLREKKQWRSGWKPIKGRIWAFHINVANAMHVMIIYRIHFKVSIFEMGNCNVRTDRVWAMIHKIGNLRLTFGKENSFYNTSSPPIISTFLIACAILARGCLNIAYSHLTYINLRELVTRTAWTQFKWLVILTPKMFSAVWDAYFRSPFPSIARARLYISPPTPTSSEPSLRTLV